MGTYSTPCSRGLMSLWHPGARSCQSVIMNRITDRIMDRIIDRIVARIIGRKIDRIRDLTLDWIIDRDHRQENG